ncbi:tyrosine-type recombinase/integrase [Halorubrum rubrum]|uniref:Tyrosine-type recombinase/integrase n=1 Tax=Halorubrum rubrum TaxID=1126240 RepID=A0ABD5R1W6_9EURY|nr:site-specific integrase [Halorubrum rubrum]
MTEHVENIVVIPEKSRNYLNNRQSLDYRSHRKQLIKWAITLGKDTEKAEGYAHETVRARSYRLDRFYRWIWQNQTDGYTLEITTEHADEYLKYLAYQEHSKTFKASCQKAIKMLFKWQNFHQGKDIDWDPVINFNQYQGTSQPRDFLTRDERRKLREASLEHGSVPHYNSVTPEERDKWKAHLAQRFGKPKEEIGMDDWKRANSWKEPSIIWTSMDAGLRPVEVGRARTSWVDLENGLLRIPREDSSKNTENWTVSLLERTTNILKKWIEEREQYPKYEDTDKLWLTRNDNPYGTQSLNYLLERVCKTADLPKEDRDLTWYSIRHSVGTYMAREEGLAAAQAQLRHKSEQTTMKYDQAPLEDRKEALERMG